MSDKLSDLLRTIEPLQPPKNSDPEQRVIEALEKALAATTPEHPGTPWDRLESEAKILNYIFKIEAGE